MPFSMSMTMWAKLILITEPISTGSSLAEEVNSTASGASGSSRFPLKMSNGPFSCFHDPFRRQMGLSG